MADLKRESTVATLVQSNGSSGMYWRSSCASLDNAGESENTKISHRDTDTVLDA
ncbi:hypothetical protein VIBC2010_17744 [Vibrio caribbeanicus ATCC BAA-2122]|uniref:Uncharacterized protein n=1 Tax=Vibrio caribbeanicus ATCC BAA-2122 TaxID=796620 RepID=E3BHA8_9VIBR|nr:hypothetical protein VIBC2010_17744 [Vibrio caribbeanicus ATCC BAA-2122]